MGRPPFSAPTTDSENFIELANPSAINDVLFSGDVAPGETEADEIENNTGKPLIITSASTVYRQGQTPSDPASVYCGIRKFDGQKFTSIVKYSPPEVVTGPMPIKIPDGEKIQIKTNNEDSNTVDRLTVVKYRGDETGGSTAAGVVEL
jgi:hypothetical protein